MGLSVHFSKNWAITQKRFIVERQRRNLDLRGVWRMHVGIFDLVHIKLILGYALQAPQPEHRGLWASCFTDTKEVREHVLWGKES